MPHICHTYPSEGSTEGTSRVPETHSRVQLVSSVIHGHHVDCTRQETSLKASKEYATYNEPSVALSHALTHGDDTYRVPRQPIDQVPQL